LVFKNAFAIIQQAPNERAFAIVHTAGSRETEEAGFFGVELNVH
jgi:hypothetical protein